MILGKFCHPNVKYSFIKKLADGSASKIFLAKNKETVQTVIVKRINKKEEWKAELKILKHITESKSKRLLKFLDSYETDRFVYIVTEKYDGYDLFDHIDINVPYSLSYSKLLIREMAKCIRDCHRMGVAHLDIKCENYMSLEMEPKPKLILIDFGHAEKIEEDYVDVGYSKYGTTFYLCPEGYDKEYSMKSDIWSLGVCAHLILSGDYPFKGNEKDYVKNIKAGKLSLHRYLDPISIQFLRNCLHIDPEKRYSIDQVLESKFLCVK